MSVYCGRLRTLLDNYYCSQNIVYILYILYIHSSEYCIWAFTLCTIPHSDPPLLFRIFPRKWHFFLHFLLWQPQVHMVHISLYTPKLNMRVVSKKNSSGMKGKCSPPTLFKRNKTKSDTVELYSQPKFFFQPTTKKCSIWFCSFFFFKL